MSERERESERGGRETESGEGASNREKMEGERKPSES